MEESGSNLNWGADPNSSSQSQSETRRFSILLIEDSETDVFLVRESLASSGLNAALQVLDDGDKASRFIFSSDEDRSIPGPDLVLLDLNLPKASGLEVLARLRQSDRYAHIPVIIMTSSDAKKDRADSAALGATDYFRKPSSYDEFLKLGAVIQGLLPSP